MKSIIFHGAAVGSATTRFSGIRTIVTEEIGNEFHLHDPIRNIKTYKYRPSNQIVKNTVNIWDWEDFIDNVDTDNDASAALDAHWGASRTYDYLLNRHGRNSFDDNGAEIRCYINTGTDAGAVWNHGGGYADFSNGDINDYLLSFTRLLMQVD